MALSPSIPTSFVPKQPVSNNHRTGNNIFLLVAIVIFVLTLAAAGGVFMYDKYLQGTVEKKGLALIEEQKKINNAQVEEFVRLKSRLIAAESLINEHVNVSKFFDLLEQITLENVQFNSLQIEVNEDRTASMTLAGTAKTFNALAAESKVFASQPYIKSAIFSGITPDPTKKTVSFTVKATLDSRLVVESQDDITTTGVNGSGTASSSIPARLPSVTSASSTSSL